MSRAPSPRPSGSPATVAAGAGGLSSKPRRQLQSKAGAVGTSRVQWPGPQRAGDAGTRSGTRTFQRPRCPPRPVAACGLGACSEPGAPGTAPQSPHPPPATRGGTSCQPTPPVPPQAPHPQPTEREASACVELGQEAIPLRGSKPCVGGWGVRFPPPRGRSRLGFVTFPSRPLPGAP